MKATETSSGLLKGTENVSQPTFSPLAAEHVMKDRTAAQTSAGGGLRGDKSRLVEEELRPILAEGEIYLEQGDISNMLSSAAAAGLRV